MSFQELQIPNNQFLEEMLARPFVFFPPSFLKILN